MNRLQIFDQKTLELHNNSAIKNRRLNKRNNWTKRLKSSGSVSGTARGEVGVA